MNIPATSTVTMIVSATSVAVALAMLFLVVWQAPRCRENQLMGLYAATVAFWGVSTFMARFALLIGYDPLPFAYGIGYSIGFSGLWLFVLVLRQTRLWGRLRIILVTLFGLFFYLFILTVVFNGRSFNYLWLAKDGNPVFELSGIGYIAAGITFFFYLASLGILWVSRHKRARSLLPGAVFVVIAAFSTLSPPLTQWPVSILAATISSILFTHAILRERLFTPLIELNQQLMQSEKRLRTVITNAPIVLWATDKNGALTLIEGKGLELARVSAKELIGQPLQELYPALPEVHENLRRALAGEEVSHILRTADFTYEVKYTPMRDEAGQVVGVIGVSNDITQRMQAQEALQESETRYRAIIEDQTELICRFLPDGTLTFVNQAYARYWGKQPDELIGQNFMPTIYETDLPAFEKQIASVSVYSPVTHLECRVKLNGGELRWQQWAVRAMFDDAGFFMRFQAVGRDITEQKRAQIELNERMSQMATLREIEAELSDVLDMNRVMQLALDSAVRLSVADAGFIGLVEGDLVRIVQIIGYPAEILGSYLSFDHGIIGRVLRQQRGELIRDVSRDPDYVSRRTTTRSQITIPLLSQERLIGVVNLESSKPERFTDSMFEFLELLTGRVAVAIDNAQLYQQTETQLEELREIYAELSTLEQLKTEMIRIAAHDLRNPLGTINGYVELLRSDIGDLLGPMPLEFLDAIQRSVSRMQHITANILSLERIEQAAHQKQAEQIDLQALVEKTVDEYREQAQLKGQVLRVTTAPAAVEGDSAQIHEALANLLNNAIKYTPEGGRIDVSLKPNQTYARFEVVDTGYGIPEDQQERLFQPFFRAQTVETRQIDGTGLGLHLVKNIVERHRGTMVFQSVYGQGSTFGFELPMAPTTPPDLFAGS